MGQDAVVDCAEVQGAAADDEQVPYRMHVGNAVREVEADAGCIDHATRDGQVEGCLADASYQVR